MKIGRRKFFGLAGAAAVGGKRAASDVLSEMGGVPMPPSMLPNPTSAMLGGGDYIAQLQGNVAKMAAIRAVGIPSFLQEYFRDWFGDAGPNLDDINCLVSISDSAKKRMIKEKMAECHYQSWLDRPSKELRREMFNREFGVSL